MSDSLRPHIASTSAQLLAEVLRRSGLSQAQLARRAGLPRSVLNAYVRGKREPGADVTMRVVAAAGLGVELVERRPPVDPDRAAEILVQVLELAEALPFRPRAENSYPPLASRFGGSAA